MKSKFGFILVSSVLLSCATEVVKNDTKATSNPLQGTWRLIMGTLIEKGDTTVTDYMKNKSFIKIINADHFAFLEHDLQKGKDSTTDFSAGGGSYSLDDSTYTEHLEYCSAREWERNDFTFTIHIKDDTLTQQGVEKVKGTGINRINIEEYVRMKSNVD